MKSKQKRLEEVAQNRRRFRDLRASIISNFPNNSPRFERDANFFDAEYDEQEAKDLESEAPEYFNFSIKKLHGNAAINYYLAGIYSVFISDPLTAFKCFKKSARNYRELAELVKQEPLYGPMLQEANVADNNAQIAMHEAAYRRARLLRISFGFLGRN